MKKYRAVYERERDGRWTVELPDVPGCHTYGRTIDQARARLREALSLFVPERTAAAAEFAEDIRLPKQFLKDVQVARSLRAELEVTRARLAEAERRAVIRLRQEAHLGHRDAGELLGLSHQRVHQLEKSAE
jgi:predicted RNase H-like HicB family nuclease/DNA-binding XRE family transcriptional regulator